MRLAVEVSTCSSRRAGIGYYTEHLADALWATRAPGDDVVLISNGRPAAELDDRWRDRLLIGGIPVRSVWMQRDVPGLLAGAGADFAVFPNYLAPLGGACPYVNIVHDLAIIRTPGFFNVRKLALQRPLLPLVVRRAAAVGTVSEASRQDIVRLLGVPEHRVLLLPGAAHPACRPQAAGEVARVRRAYGIDRPYVLSVGTLEPRKNLPLLLRAFDRLMAARAGARARDVDLVVIGGRGWRDRELRAEIARRLATGRLHVLGYVPEADLVPLYGGAEVLAFASHFEGFGLPLIEAMACGTPVVSTDVLALREVSGGAATLVPPGDEAALADAIAGFIGDAGARERARARGFVRAAAFSWETTAERLWRFARQTAGARGVTTALTPTLSRKQEREKEADLPVAAQRGESRGEGAAIPAGGGDPDWSILVTVAYADLFDAPITVDEVARTCVGARVDAAEVRRRAAARPLADLLAVDEAGHITLRGREALVARRADGDRRTAELLATHERVIAWLASLPFVRMLALSGGTAHRNARGGDDIDLFVVARAGRAYTAYTMLFLASVLTRRRGIVCPNYLVDEDNLRIAYHHDLFTAHQAVSLVPIAGLGTFADFVAANRAWVRGFYPSYVPRPPGAVVAPSRWQPLGERLLAWSAGDEIERLLSAGWRFHLARRAASAPRPDLVLDPGILKLHLSDHRRNVMERFSRRLGELRRRWKGGGGDHAARQETSRS
jgi:glycosyltransferase involved in cell wall biosynthesis